MHPWHPTTTPHPHIHQLLDDHWNNFKKNEIQIITKVIFSNNNGHLNDGAHYNTNVFSVEMVILMQGDNHKYVVQQANTI